MGSVLRQTALVALSLLVLLLLREVRALKEQAADHRRDDWTLTAGMYVPTFSAPDSRAAPVLSDRPQRITIGLPAGAEFPVVRFPGGSFAAMYRSSLVPQTVIVDSTGRVTYARVGVLETRSAVDSVLTAWSAVTAAGERRLQTGG